VVLLSGILTLTRLVRQRSGGRGLLLLRWEGKCARHLREGSDELRRSKSAQATVLREEWEVKFQQEEETEFNERLHKVRSWSLSSPERGARAEIPKREPRRDDPRAE
jgi:hypothetical protein